MDLEIPGLGKLVEYADMGWHESEPISLALINGEECRVVFDGYTEECREGYLIAVTNLLACDFSTLRQVESDIYAYYQDCNSYWQPGEEGHVEIATPADVWKHVQFGASIVISNYFRDGHCYASMECECDWEVEHGLQVVLRNGSRVNKVGCFDGHVTNANAYGREVADEVIYLRRGA